MPKLVLPRNWHSTRPSLSVTSRYGAATGNVSPFSTSVSRNGYADTINNLKIGKHTKVIYQGFTGKLATANAKESIAYGTNVVGGVKPGTEGEHMGLPVFPSVRAAMEKVKPDVTGIYVPGGGTVKAMEEAIEAEIPLMVAVAEHIPIHDMLRVHQMLRTQSKTRLVGANCPGIINTWGRCRVGFQPLPFFQEGNIGIIAKSGTLSYEVVASTTRAGLGQSYGISMGGDVVAGTNFVEAFELFEHDEKTEGIVMVGEIGGRAESDAAEWVQEYRKRVSDPKPIVAVIGGLEAPPRRVMGHAGAWAAPGEASGKKKVELLEKAGIQVVDHPEKVGEAIKKLLAEQSSARGGGSAKAGVMQRRGYHTMRQRPTIPRPSRNVLAQKRTLYITQAQAFDLLKQKGLNLKEGAGSSDQKLITVTIDRSTRQPCVLASASTATNQIFSASRRFPFAYGSDEATSDAMIERLAKHINLPESGKPALTKLVGDLVDIFTNKEAFLLETRVTFSESGECTVESADFGFDDAAYRSNKRQADIHALRDVDSEPAEEIAAEKEGMAYVKLKGDGTLGTLVNGAGLAMNTVDALIARGASPANFLDTGGKATSDTIKASFKILTSDPRVKAIFVNIFGGLTLGDMIANGILMAFKDVDIKVPVVVRIRGTNEKEGQDIIKNSGLKLDAYDSFEEAADRAIALANGTAK